MGEYSSLGIYLLGFIAFSYVMYYQNKIVKIQRKMIAEDMDTVGRAQAALCRIIDISCLIFDNPDKYQDEIKKFKDSRDELIKFAEKMKTQD